MGGINELCKRLRPYGVQKYNIEFGTERLGYEARMVPNAGL